MIGGKDIIRIKSNFIPKGIIPLEKLFDQNDVAKKPKVQPHDYDIQYQNIGMEDFPKIIKLSKKLSIETKKKYIELMKKYFDVFSWRYEYLKECDTSIMQHIILVKLGEKTFRKKLRRINPMLLPLI